MTRPACKPCARVRRVLPAPVRKRLEELERKQNERKQIARAGVAR
jgi:hypothetical protein